MRLNPASGVLRTLGASCAVLQCSVLVAAPSVCGIEVSSYFIILDATFYAIDICDDFGCVQGEWGGAGFQSDGAGSTYFGDFGATDGGLKEVSVGGQVSVTSDGVMPNDGLVARVEQRAEASVYIDSRGGLYSIAATARATLTSVHEISGLPTDRFNWTISGVGGELDVSGLLLRPGELTIDGLTPGMYTFTTTAELDYDYLCPGCTSGPTFGWNFGDSWSAPGSPAPPFEFSAALLNDTTLELSRNTEVGGWLEGGEGLSARPWAMLVQNDALVVGGTFVTAGEQTVNRIARWNGAEWSGFGPGLNGGVLDLIEFEGDLIACGGFTRPVGQPTVLDRVARWDGSAWVPMGAGFNARVNDLEIVDGVLYAGGPFTMSGDEPVSKLARWNAATQSWEEAIGIIDGEVKALRAVPDFNPGIDTLAFGGNFTSINGSAANGVVILDPAGGWMNILAPGNHDIEALAISKVVTGVRIFGLSVDYARVLMFGGLFDSDGMTNLGALRYDNVPELIPLGASGPDGRVRAIEVFNTLPPEFAFDGDDYARSVEGGYYDDVVLIGGDFASVGGVAAARVARFDGDGWAPLGGGVSDFVGVITVFDGEVWAGGEFTEADGWPASKLARWTLDAPPPPVCQGDVNGDGVVNFSDLNAVLTDFGATGSGIPGDVNGDGVVNFADLNTVLTNFGFVCE